MKKHPILAFIVCIVFIISAFTASSEGTIVDSMEFQGDGRALTLAEAIEIALSGNASVVDAKLTLEQAKISHKISIRQIEKLTKDIDEGDKIVNTRDYMQNVTVPRLNAEKLLLGAQMRLDSLVDAQKAAVENLYFSLRHAEKQCDINRENLEISKAMLEKIRKKYDLGLVAKQEILKGESAVLNAEIAYNVTLNSITKLKMSMNNTLGFNLMDELILTDELTYREFEEGSIAQAVNDAIVNSDDIKLLDLEKQIAEWNLTILGRQYPEGTYAYSQEKINVDKAVKALEDEKKVIELKVRENYLDVIQTQDAIRSGEMAVKLAEEMFRLSQTTYDAGLGLLTDVQAAQLELQGKKLGLSKAILDYNLAVLNYKESIGME